MGNSSSANPKYKEMKKQKNILIDTARILNLPLQEIQDSSMIGILDMSNEVNEYDINNNDTLVIANYAMASIDQMFPGYNVMLRDCKFRPRFADEYQYSLFTRRLDLTTSPGDMIVGADGYDSKMNQIEAIKYFIPSANYAQLSHKNIDNMTFQTGKYISFNGLKFYPTSIISKDIVQFKSDGLIISVKNEKLISQLKEALARNKIEIDRLYDGDDGNSELSEGGALLGERRIIKKQLEKELVPKTPHKIFLTLNIPVKWSCIAHCYWVNLSIIK